MELRASLNKGLSPALVKSFPNINPVIRPLVKSTEILDMNWLSGFVDGEGCFYVNLTNNKTKTGFTVKLNFNLTQHIRDLVLFKEVQKCLACGYLQEIPLNSRVNFLVTKFSDIMNIVVPFFNK